MTKKKKQPTRKEQLRQNMDETEKIYSYAQKAYTSVCPICETRDGEYHLNSISGWGDKLCSECETEIMADFKPFHDAIKKMIEKYGHDYSYPSYFDAWISMICQEIEKENGEKINYLNKQ